jgi:hypothetical protein
VKTTFGNESADRLRTQGAISANLIDRQPSATIRFLLRLEIGQHFHDRLQGFNDVDAIAHELDGPCGRLEESMITKAFFDGRQVAAIE